MRTRRCPSVRGIIKVASPLILLVGTACAVVESSPTSSSVHCTSAAGSYNLPKTVLRVRYQEFLDVSSAKVRNSGYEVTSLIVSDGQPVCLDYVGVPTASDDLKIIRSRDSGERTVALGGASGILQVITNKSRDFTGTILRKIARTIFVGLSGKPGFEATGGRALLNAQDGKVVVDVLDLMFDPLDPLDLARANERLNDVGMCILLGHYSYNPEQTTPDKYCDNPLGQAKAAPTIVPELTLPLMTLEPSTPGIIYRPRKAYLVNLFGKRDPKGLEPWLMIQSQQVAFENLSPVFSIGIDRALFAERRTAMIFDDGALKTVCTTKGSEILGFIEVPLEVVRSVVALPSQILKVDMDEVRNRTKLNQAQAEVLKLQDEILRRELGLTEELPAKNKGASGEAEQQGLSTFVQSDSENEDVIAAPTIKQANSLLNELCGTNSKVEGI